MLEYILYLIGIVAMVWVIYDVWANNKKANTTKKVIYTVFAIFFSIITAIVYYFLEKK